MNAVFIVAIIFGGIVLAVAVVGGTILMAIKLRQDGLSRRGRHARSEDARMVQEIYQGLARMEERVEALETILLDRQGKEH
jgi:phage shock protein B